MKMEEELLELPSLKFMSETARQFTQKSPFNPNSADRKREEDFNLVKVTWNAETEEIVRKVYEVRNRSVYQVSYGVKEGETLQDAFDDHMMLYFSSLYGGKSGPVLNPPQTGKTIFGIRRPERYYIQMTTYQDEIGRGGFNRLKVDFEKGISRLYKPRVARPSK